MTDGISLTYKKKVLLYLRDYIGVEEEDILPVDITQEGISEGVDMPRTHVSRVVQGLIEDDLLKERRSHIKGKNRKLKAYTLTQKGMKKADDIISGLSNFDIDIVKEGEEKKIPVTDVAEETNGRMGLLDVINHIESSGEAIDMRSIGEGDTVRMMEEAPVVDDLYGRGKTLESIDDWFKGEVPIAVLNGRRGFGSSSIARRYVDSVEERHVLWINIHDRSLDEIEQRIREFLESSGERQEGDLIDELKSIRPFIILDDYYDVNGEVVDFLTELTEEVEHGDEIKILVTAREGTPVYERFYQIDHIDENKVEEIDVPSLEREEAKKILGAEIEDGALKRIMLMTKGSPLLLNLLREGEEKRLREITPLSKQQISLLMFLKTQTKEG